MFRRSYVQLAVCAVLGVSTSAFANEPVSELKLLRQQVELLRQKIEALEASQSQQDRSIALQADQQKEMIKQAAEQKSNPFEDVSFSASFVAVGQNISSGRSTAGTEDSQLNYRADFEVEMPLGQFDPAGPLGDAQGVLFTHFRVGQGNGIAPATGTFTGALNSTAFQLASPAADESTALLAQMWYQLNVPVSRGVSGTEDQFSLTVGKIDPFVFFDNNAIADDESEYFLNNVFVHNPLLDSGGDIGADTYGFSPGVVADYVFAANSDNKWSLKGGVFGAGNGANFNNSLNDPFSIFQVQYEGETLSGLAGTYQLYVWNNPQSTSVLNAALVQDHSGVGLSASQSLSDHLTVFSRVGVQTQGDVAFDQTLTLGGVLTGSNWGRESDKLGFAVGLLKASDENRIANGVNGTEKNYELFYQYQINDNLHIAPSVNYVQDGAGDQNAENITVIGVRTKASF